MSDQGQLFNSFWNKMDELTKPRPLSEKEKQNRRLERDQQEPSGLPLYNTEDLFHSLTRNPSLVVIDAEEAASIYKLFCRETIDPTSLKPSHIAFLQAAIMAAIDGSFAIGFVNVIFDAAFMKPVFDARSFLRVLRKLAKDTLKHLFKNAKDKPITDVKVYAITISAIKYSCNPYFTSIKLGDDI